MMRATLLALAIAAVALPKAHTAPKASPKTTPQAGASAQIGEWNLQTDQLSANLATGEFSAPDHVTLTRADGSVIQADRATGNYKQRQAALYGHVSVHDASGTFGLKSAQTTQTRGPATLTSDELHLDDTAHLYDANGNVHYEQADTKADSQTAHLNDTTHQLDLTGKVHVVQADRTLDADTASYNTVSGDGTAQNNVTVTFPGITPSIATPRPIRIKGPKIP
jgi:lipopolysaccharide assembly outer membrane protein LptD (OstA)